MSYCTPTQVVSMFRNLDLTITDPAVTEAEIQEWIDENCASMNACLSELYVLPINEIDNPESWKILRKICRYKTAATVDNVVNEYSEADKKPEWGEWAHKMMLKLCPEKDPKTCMRCEPTFKLPDTPFKGANTPGNTIAVKATSGVQFKKGRDDW